MGPIYFLFVVQTLVVVYIFLLHVFKKVFAEDCYVLYGASMGFESKIKRVELICVHIVCHAFLPHNNLPVFILDNFAVIIQAKNSKHDLKLKVF